MEQQFTPPFSSSISSSSCYSTPTTTTSMANSFTTFDRLSTSETTLFGCISLALGKFLHSTSNIRRRSLPPNYPSDHQNEMDYNPFKDSTLGGLMKASSVYPDHGGGSTTPNIVARLMGLDTIPETTESPATRNGTTTFTRSKSKSMSSISPKDWRVEEAEAAAAAAAANETKIEGSRRGTKSSFSLRETPGFFELEEDDDFLVLKFDNGDSKRKSREKEVKKIREHNMRRSRRLIEREGRCRSMENIPMFVSSYEEQGSKPSLKIPQISPIMLVNQMAMNLDGNAGRNKSRRRRRRRKRRSEKWLLDVKLEVESDDAENSSPVSVLDQSGFVNSDHEVITSAEDDKRKNQNLSPRRKLLSELWQMEKSSSSSAECDDFLEGTSSSLSAEEANAAGEEIESEEGKTIEPAATGLARKEYHKLHNVDMLSRVCRLAEMDLQQSSNSWNCSNKRPGNQTTTYWDDEIGRELSLQIADELLEDLVNQLVSS